MLEARCELLRSLHVPGTPLVLPNAWDVASARAVVAAGFPVVATTSGGLAASLGFEDHEAAPADEMLAAAARIARSVDVPVTVDAESGYGMAPEDLVEALSAAGAAGCNLEVTDHATDALVDVDLHAERLAAVREAASARGYGLVVNARIDVFIVDGGVHAQLDLVDDAVARARSYRAAGADCVFPIFLYDLDAIVAFVHAVQFPVNILALPQAPARAELARVGVARISYGSLFHHRTMEALAGSLRDLASGSVAPMHGPARVGSLEVSLVCEGWAPLPLADECPGHAVDWARERDRFPWVFAGEDAWRWHVHAFLIHAPHGAILIDSGVGAFGPWAPWAESAGPGAWAEIDVADVRRVVLTHLHADHAGGTISADGTPRFPNATYHVHPSDWDHFAERPEPQGYDARAAMAGLTSTGVLDLAAEDHEVSPGVRVIHTPGHTPGHRSVMVTDGDDVMLFTGDLLHMPIQVAHPDWPSSHDQEAEVASRSRTDMLARASRGGWRVAVSHFALPFGRVDDLDGRSRWSST